MEPGHHEPMVKSMAEAKSMLDFTEARMWIKKCEDEHQGCRNLKLLHTKQLPTRLISVGSQDSQIHMCYSSSLSSECDRRYMTLSHCWGKLKFTVLRTSNHDEFLERIPVEELTKTFKDAIRVCRSLGISYIWIDSLCIIQDSEGGIDWHREAPRMHLVYGNSYLNLAASASSDGSGGLFRDYNPILYTPCIVSIANDGPETYMVDDGYLFKGDFESSPLHSRGWVVQELFLSPRTLHFTNEAQWWQCKDDVLPQRGDGHLSWTYSWENPDGSKTAEELVHTNWRLIVSDYSRAKLTYPSDRVVALTGLRQEFTRHFIEAGKPQEYIAGQWSGHMIYELLWYRTFPILELPIPSIAPSRSWLSVNGPIDHRSGPWSTRPLYYQYAKFVRATTMPRSASEFEEDKHWSALELTGPIIRVCGDGTNFHTFHRDCKVELEIFLYFDDNTAMSTMVCVVFGDFGPENYYGKQQYIGLVLEEQEPHLNILAPTDIPLYKRRGLFTIMYLPENKERNQAGANVIFKDVMSEAQTQRFWLC